MGVGRGAGEAMAPPGFGKCQKRLFLVSSGKKTNLTSFGPPWKNFETIPWCPNLEKILPTHMAEAGS